MDLDTNEEVFTSDNISNRDIFTHEIKDFILNEWNDNNLTSFIQDKTFEYHSIASLQHVKLLLYINI